MRYTDVATMMSGEAHGKEQIGRSGQATSARRSAATDRQEPAGGGAPCGCAAANGVPLAGRARRRWHRRAARHEQRRTAAAAWRRGIDAAICNTARGRSGAWFCQSAVDAQTSPAVDRARVRRAVQRGALLALARPTGLLQPEAGSARPGARPRRYRTLAQAHLAGAKKNAAREGRLIVFIDESGVSERPTRVRTWGLKGQTPVVQFHFNWHQLSLIAGMHFTGMCFRLHEGAIAKEQVVEFLKALLAHFRRPLLILWDRSQPHRSILVRDYVAS